MQTWLPFLRTGTHSEEAAALSLPHTEPRPAVLWMRVATACYSFAQLPVQLFLFLWHGLDPAEDITPRASCTWTNAWVCAHILRGGFLGKRPDC